MRTTLEETPKSEKQPKKAFHRNLWVQVLAAVGIAIVLGYVRPQTAVAMQPLGDAFIRLISMVITLVIFCTVVAGIAGMGNLKKVGRVGGKALLYFEVVTTIALLFGMRLPTAIPKISAMVVWAGRRCFILKSSRPSR